MEQPQITMVEHSYMYTVMLLMLGAYVLAAIYSIYRIKRRIAQEQGKMSMLTAAAGSIVAISVTLNSCLPISLTADWLPEGMHGGVMAFLLKNAIVYTFYFLMVYASNYLLDKHKNTAAVILAVLPFALYGRGL